MSGPPVLCPNCQAANQPTRSRCWTCDRPLEPTAPPPRRRWVSSNPLLATIQFVAAGVAALLVLGALGLALLFVTCVASM
jgi:predicted amidophosphoribosyltransferase